MAMLDQLNDFLSNKLSKDLAEFIADKMGLDVIIVSEIIKKFLDQEPIKKKRVKKRGKGSKQCAFVITRGPNKGLRCESPVNKSSDATLCSKHNDPRKKI